MDRANSRLDPNNRIALAAIFARVSAGPFVEPHPMLVPDDSDHDGRVATAGNQIGSPQFRTCPVLHHGHRNHVCTARLVGCIGWTIIRLVTLQSVLCGCDRLPLCVPGVFNVWVLRTVHSSLHAGRPRGARRIDDFGISFWFDYRQRSFAMRFTRSRAGTDHCRGNWQLPAWLFSAVCIRHRAGHSAHFHRYILNLHRRTATGGYLDAGS